MKKRLQKHEQILDAKILAVLINKGQLNNIITNKDGSPDYLAINIYYDSLRSWYSPKKQYQEDGNVLHIRKLKSNGIYYSTEQLAQIHGCSKETIRRKLAKLEQLGLIHRNFDHTSNPTNNSYNHRCIFVWKSTPHFYNAFGVDRKKIKKLKSQTNAEYIADKYGVEFGAKAKEDIVLEEGGGIHTLEDTKELRESFNKLKDRSNAQAPESNFYDNSISDIKTKIPEPVETKKIVSRKSFIPNSRKKPTNAEQKANVIKISKKRSSTKTLADIHGTLDQETFDELRHKSGRDFTNHFITELILKLSRKPKITASFNCRQGFINYIAKALMYEKHDAVKTSGTNFYFKSCRTKAEIAVHTTQAEREAYLAAFEDRAITDRSDENQLKAKWACTLPTNQVYNFLSNFVKLRKVDTVLEISLSKAVELTQHSKSLALQAAQAIGEFMGVERLEIIHGE
jgi:hypothetical protein